MKSGYCTDMRKKISTLVDETLFRRAKLEAVRQGRQISEIVGESLELYLGGKGGRGAGSDIVASSFGVLKFPKEKVRKLLAEEDSLLDA
ncbi:MAG: hypothetical protein WEF99_07045 [Thermoanaerobaculia bacterium]